MVYLNNSAISMSVHHIPHNRDQEKLYENSMAEAIKVPKSDEITEERKDRAAMLLLAPRGRFMQVPAYRNLLHRVCEGEIGERLGNCVIIDNVLSAMERQ